LSVPHSVSLPTIQPATRYQSRRPARSRGGRGPGQETQGRTRGRPKLGGVGEPTTGWWMSWTPVLRIWTFGRPTGHEFVASCGQLPMWSGSADRRVAAGLGAQQGDSVVGDLVPCHRHPECSQSEHRARGSYVSVRSHSHVGEPVGKQIGKQHPSDTGFRGSAPAFPTCTAMLPIHAQIGP
jgi:hypothetical protein